MALRHAVLAALLEGEASGYELAKRFDASVANYWTATSQQLYRELERLEAGGFVAARVVHQERRPNKRLFEITVAGREDLAAFIAHSTRPLALRDELLVKLQAMDVGDPAAVDAAIEQRVDQARVKLAHYERLAERALGGMPEDEYLRTADHVGPYLTLLRGIAFEQETIAWGARVLQTLAQRAAERRGVPASAG